MTIAIVLLIFIGLTTHFEWQVNRLMKNQADLVELYIRSQSGYRFLVVEESEDDDSDDYYESEDREWS